MADGSWGKILVTTIFAPIVVAVVGTQFSDVASDWFKSRKEPPPPVAAVPASPPAKPVPLETRTPAPPAQFGSGSAPAAPRSEAILAATPAPATPTIPAPAPPAASPPTPGDGAESARKASELATRAAAAVAAMRNSRILFVIDKSKASVCGLEVGVEVYPQSGAGGSIVLVPPAGQPVRFSVGARNEIAPGCSATLLNTMQDVTTRAQIRETKAQ